MAVSKFYPTPLTPTKGSKVKYLNFPITKVRFCCGCSLHRGRQQVARVSNTKPQVISVLWTNATKAVCPIASPEAFRPCLLWPPSSSGVWNVHYHDRVDTWGCMLLTKNSLCIFKRTISMSCFEHLMHIFKVFKRELSQFYVQSTSKTCVKWPLSKRPKIGFQD